MKKTLFTAAALLLCGQAFAAPHLFIGDNVSVLAARSTRVSIFSKDVMLPDGAQKMIVKFDSPVNPESVNNNRGRVTSNPYIISFTASGNEEIHLSTGNPLDEKEAKQMAQKPVFTVTAGGKSVPFDNDFGSRYSAGHGRLRRRYADLLSWRVYFHRSLWL